MQILRAAALLLLTVSFACAPLQTYAFGAANDGSTTTVPVGSEVRFVLPADFEWTIEATDATALQPKSAASTSLQDGAVRIWTFDLKKAGTFIVRTTGNPRCAKDVPACALPPVLYRFTISAQ